MRLRLILPLLAALALAACESMPEETSSITGEGAEQAGMADATAPVDSTDMTGPDKTEMPPTPEIEMREPEPVGPLPGSQEDLVQNYGDRVFFEFDSAVLLPDARRTLERQSEWLRLFPEVTLTIEGHCDERGTREYNLALGERRANAVREYLITQGITPSRLRTVSYGKERPYALGHNEEAWALNRRSVSIID